MQGSDTHADEGVLRAQVGVHGGDRGQLNLAVAAGATALTEISLGRVARTSTVQAGCAKERGAFLQAVAVLPDFGYNNIHLVARVDFFAGALPQPGRPGGLLGEGHHVR